MKDAVLRLRRPNSSAPRPYDAELIPAANVSPVTLGVEWKSYTNAFPWVPELTTLPASGQRHHQQRHIDGATARQ